MTMEGGCFCGAIRYQVDGPPRRVTHCHCLHCRRTSGAPFGKIDSGDQLFFKITSGPVCATGRVQKVMSFDNLTPKRLQQIRRTYNDRIIAPGQYWTGKRNCKRGVLIWLEHIKPIEPVWIDKKDWRAWVVLTSQSNFGLLDG